MRKLIAVVALALVAACGGEEDEAQGQQDICREYEVELGSGVYETSCISADWPSGHFCWRTGGDDCPDGEEEVGCDWLLPEQIEQPQQRSTDWCWPAFDCQPNVIDNPACCGDTFAEGPGFDCAD